MISMKLKKTFCEWAFLHLVSTVLLKTFNSQVQFHISEQGICFEEREDIQKIIIQNKVLLM